MLACPSKRAQVRGRQQTVFHNEAFLPLNDIHIRLIQVYQAGNCICKFILALKPVYRALQVLVCRLVDEQGETAIIFACSGFSLFTSTSIQLIFRIFILLLILLRFLTSIRDIPYLSFFFYFLSPSPIQKTNPRHAIIISMVKLELLASTND